MSRERYDATVDKKGVIVNEVGYIPPECNLYINKRFLGFLEHIKTQPSIFRLCLANGPLIEGYSLRECLDKAWVHRGRISPSRMKDWSTWEQAI